MKAEAEAGEAGEAGGEEVVAPDGRRMCMCMCMCMCMHMHVHVHVHACACACMCMCMGMGMGMGMGMCMGMCTHPLRGQMSCKRRPFSLGGQTQSHFEMPWLRRFCR